MSAPPPPSASSRLSLRRLTALMRKESLQVVRDPSAILIAFVLPVVLLFLFAFAVSLDLRQAPFGVVLETESAQAQSLAAAFSGSRYFAVRPERDRRAAGDDLVAGRVRGFVVIPSDFDERLQRGGSEPLVQIVTDGSQPNTASFIASYAEGVVSLWRADGEEARPARVSFTPRFWFNPELDSRRVFIPGAIAIVMTIVGTLLTALVVAREWERGTMEALMATPAGVTEILLGKLLPYFALGLIACIGAGLVATVVLGVPLRGSWFALILTSAVFLLPALGQGLLISALARNQFIAAQAALFSGLLPAFLLSGFLFEIASMPAPLQVVAHAVPARYFVSSLQTIFLAGDVWALILPNMAAMAGIGAVFLSISRARTPKSLDV